MTTQAIWKPLIPKLPFTGDAKQIAPFLDGVTSAKAMQVSKHWHSGLRGPRDALYEDRVCVQEGFPEVVVEAFRARNLSLWRLPVIDRAKIDARDYLVLKREHLPPGVSLARFEDDFGRAGLTLDVQGNIDQRISRAFEEGDRVFNVRDFKGVVSVFRRYTNSDRWVKDCSVGDELLSIYNDLHDPKHTGSPGAMCPTCPKFRADHSDGCKEFLVRMVSGTDSVFKLAGPIEQVANPPPLPKLLPKPNLAPKIEPMGWCAWVASIVESVVSFVRSILAKLGL